MYAHIYTASTSEEELQIWWYFVPDSNSKLFEDFQSILKMYMKLQQIKTYTGDILKIKDEKTFVEQLILMGVTIPATLFNTLLQDKSVLKLNYGTTRFVNEFNDLYSVCFVDYDILETFSSDTVNSISTGIKSNEIIHINLFNKHFYSPKFKLNCIAYDTLVLNTSNEILINWFKYFNDKSYFNKEEGIAKYNAMCDILTRLFNESITKSTEDTGDKEEVAEEKEEKSEYKLWIEEFCDLYGEKDEKVDTLLSDIYEQYLTASSWTKTETIGMSQFIKYIKKMPQFIIKRKSKGMMVIGYKFLVNQQENMYNKTKDGQMCERNLLRYMNELTIRDINVSIQKLYNPEIIKEKYYLEATCLLSKLDCKLTKTMLDQFINNPYIAPSLPHYSRYINEVLNNPKSTTHMDIYRAISSKCIIYLPFSKKYYQSYDLLFKTMEIKETPTLDVTGYDPNEIIYTNVSDLGIGSTDINDILKGFELTGFSEKKTPNLDTRSEINTRN